MQSQSALFLEELSWRNQFAYVLAVCFTWARIWLHQVSLSLSWFFNLSLCISSSTSLLKSDGLSSIFFIPNFIEKKFIHNKLYLSNNLNYDSCLSVKPPLKNRIQTFLSFAKDSSCPLQRISSSPGNHCSAFQHYQQQQVTETYSLYDSSHSTHLCLGMLLQLTWVTPTHPAGLKGLQKAFNAPSQHPFKHWVRGSSIFSFSSLYLSRLYFIILFLTHYQTVSHSDVNTCQALTMRQVQSQTLGKKA